MFIGHGMFFLVIVCMMDNFARKGREMDGLFAKLYTQHADGTENERFL